MTNNNRIISELRDFARATKVACEEHISCLQESLEEIGVDVKDIEDQIGNWQWILGKANQAIANANSALGN
jgi:hypothetical protein